MQQQQQQGGSQFGADMALFGSGGRTHIAGVPAGGDHHLPPPPMAAEAASPISSRPPQPRSSFDELMQPSAAAGGGGGGFPDEDALVAAGEEAERGGVPGNRWPRQETLALLKIRSEMDATFRDATLKGPLWDDVSRKLAELGFARSAKKCKEKFENVHKYYKRTKEGRAGRQDGKSYRFFTQLEALHGATAPPTMAHPITTVPAPQITAAPVIPVASIPGPSIPRPQPTTVSLTPPPPPSTSLAPAEAAAGISFSSDTYSSSPSETDGEETEEGGASTEGRRKRKRGAAPTGGGGSRKMMAFFEGLMKQVMEKQESMQQRFLETIEKREQERMNREETWRRHEMARLNREHELMAQERAMAVSRDAAVISFLQKISGHPIPIPQPPVPVPVPAPVTPLPQSSTPTVVQPVAQQERTPQLHQKTPAPPPPPQLETPPPLPTPPQQKQEVHLPPQGGGMIVRHQQPPPSTSTELVPVPDQHELNVASGGGFEGVSSSRWPKPEVHALIKLRSDLEARYQEAGPKGPLWEEISSGMHRLGYSRSSKRCKEKWENINKYFKKVKESNKKRPEDAKTCPYFHQLDALYRKKMTVSTPGVSSSSTGGLISRPEAPNPNTTVPQERGEVLLSMAPPAPTPTPTPTPNPHPESEIKAQTSNGGVLPPIFFEEGTSGNTAMMKKPEDIMKELMEQEHQQAAMDDYDKFDEPDSDNMDVDDDEDDDDEEIKMQYKIQFQRQNVGSGGNGSAKASGPAAGAAGSFLAMVQ